MIFGIIGEGGSGKSAITVAMALDHLENYDVIFTNIKGFNKNSSVEDIAALHDTEIMIKHFENQPEAFKEILEEIEVIQADNSNDEKLKVLVLYDECHKSLRRFTNTKEEDIYMSDFFSEHRHFHTDFYFMTQGYKKVADMYKGEFKAWYLSVDDQFKSDPNHIVFKKMDKECKTKIGVKRYKKNRKWKGKSGNLYQVFDCYDSGDDGEKQQDQGSSLFAKKKYFFAVALIGALCAFYYAYANVTSMFSSEDKNSTTSTTTKTIQTKNIKNITSDTNETNTDFEYSDRFELLSNHKQNNSVVAEFVILHCLYDVQRKLYIFENRVLTQKNFDSLNDLFLLEILNTQIISENVYKYEYLVSSELSSILSSKTISSKKKQKNQSFIK